MLTVVVEGRGDSSDNRGVDLANNYYRCDNNLSVVEGNAIGSDNR